MTEYKQWHDGNVYNSQYLIGFSQCNVDRTLSLNELLKITSDVAVDDYNKQGLPREVLTKNGIALLVSRNSFRIHSMPKENQRITVKTWEEKPEPLQLVRGFDIVDDKGMSLITGVSMWITVNIAARRIMPTKFFKLRKEPELIMEHDCLASGKIAVPDDMILLDERKIRYTDIDANGHVNNSRYGAFIADSLPEQYRNKNWCDFKINYSKEAFINDTMKIYAAFDDKNNKVLIVGKTEKGNSFESELYYNDVR